MFSREEIIAVKNIPSTRKLMAKLPVLLEQEKSNTKTKGKAPMESDNAKRHKKRKTQPEMKMQLQSGGNVALIESCWKDLSVQIEQRIAKACLIISMLRRIEEILINLPATNRAIIQPSFSSLCAETDAVISKITDCMKMQCDENQSHSSVRFHKLATSTTMEPSF
uniref:uncharacterized protein LOC122591088 n=1 Tax=Erigeron canadensis TaxID=72917 RepID=UPI001CB898DE|nr:uncharacterized protein LOC122591088 [Erigeron canadensis]